MPVNIRHDQYTERGDGSLRPITLPRSPPLTQPVWQSAPYGTGVASPPRESPAPRARRRIEPSPAMDGVGPFRDTMIALPSNLTTVGSPGARRHTQSLLSSGGGALDEAGGVASAVPRGTGSSFADRDRLIAARRSPTGSRLDANGIPRSTPRRTPRSRVTTPRSSPPSTPKRQERNDVQNLTPRTPRTPMDETLEPPWGTAADDTPPRTSGGSTAMNALGAIPILKGLTDTERAKLARSLDEQSFPRGERIIVQGEE